ncbi:MAG TPA: ferrous iron transport protein B [Clostridia bacterium]
MEYANETRLVLAGNPNVGKSVFFNALTGMYVDVSNFPGTTVDISRGKFGSFIVEDTPGVYGVSSFNDEERVARDVIINGDIILNVVDAVHMQRDLFLTQQLIDMGKKIVVAVNMMDELEKTGLNIDIKKLSILLGVPVVPAAAMKNRGIEEVKQTLHKAQKGNRTEGLNELMESYFKTSVPEAEALLILEDDPVISERNNLESAGMQEEIYKRRRKRVDDIVSGVLSGSTSESSIGAAIGHALLKPLTGIPMIIVLLLAVFGFIGVLVAQYVVNFTQGTIMSGWFQPFLTGLVTKWIPGNTFLGQLLVGDSGVLIMTPVYLIGLLLPLVAGFYLVLSILEDSGTLPRIAALTDRLLSFVGLNGRAIIPIILGFGCITAATVTTRILGSKRERLIATALLGLTIPCSAQLGIITGLLAPLGLSYSILYFVIIVGIFAASGTILNKILPGESTDLFIDLPPVRLPVLGNVLKKTYLKSKMFLLEALPLFALGAVIITVINYTGFINVIQNIMSPIVTTWLKLPKEISRVFIMGIIRRDFGAAGLTSLVLSRGQTLVALVTMTLFVPCIASVMIIFKERSKSEALIIWFGSFFAAFLIGGILAQLIIR